jgi:hypothetical protein
MANQTNFLTEADLARLVNMNRRVLRTTNLRLFQLKVLARELFEASDKTNPGTANTFQMLNQVRDAIREGKQFRANQERIQKSLKKMLKG